jgi:DnaK suppressor protein
MTDYEDLHVTSDDLSDEADLATSTINQQVSFSIRNREMAKLRRIEAALHRIEDESYGICLESGEEIEEKRLETQPWAEYCLEVAEEFEREQAQRFRKQA